MIDVSFEDSLSLEEMFHEAMSSRNRPEHRMIYVQLLNMKLGITRRIFKARLLGLLPLNLELIRKALDERRRTIN